MIRERGDRPGGEQGARHRRRDPGPPDRGPDRRPERGRDRDRSGRADGAGWGEPGRKQDRDQGRGEGSPADGRRNPQEASSFGAVTADDVRRTPTGWRVGDEEVSDLTSAMVLADLLAADLPATPPTPAAPPGPDPRRTSRPDGNAAPPSGRSAVARHDAEQPDVRQLRETVAQLEHALTVRVRVEQAIGVLAERHRLRPRQAFELLRSAARARGRRVLEVAGEVVESANNPLLRIPEELDRPVAPRRGRLSRRGPRYD